MKHMVPVTILSMALPLTGCRGAATPAPVAQAVDVQTFVVQPLEGQGMVTVAGVVKAHLESDLSAQIVAPIAAITKREGDAMHQGEVLVRLHAPALGAGVAQANAALGSADEQQKAAAAQANVAAANLSRYAQLRERHSVTAYELDEMRAQSLAAAAQAKSAAAQVSAAREAVAMQRANAADATLYAPFDGVVTRRLVDPGAMAGPGVPILHLQSNGARDVEFSVPEALLKSIHVGGDVAVELGSETPVSARVATIAPAGDAGSHSFLVKAGLPASTSWSPGTVVQVELPSKEGVSRVVIPSKSLVQQGGLDAVIAVSSDDVASVRYVTLGNAQGDMTEILTGLRAGDRLVADGNLSMAGKKIVVRP